MAQSIATSDGALHYADSGTIRIGKLVPRYFEWETRTYPAQHGARLSGCQMLVVCVPPQSCAVHVVVTARESCPNRIGVKQ
jgi:hypothetical protein